MRKYYTLAVKNISDNKWSPEFGDYTKSVVEYERQEFRRNYPANRLQIITSGDSQFDINAAIRNLNGTCITCENPPLPGYRVCQACGEEGIN